VELEELWTDIGFSLSSYRFWERILEEKVNNGGVGMLK
jgi:hypothetical protein